MNTKKAAMNASVMDVNSHAIEFDYMNSGAVKISEG
jgi:hypothetical protein